MAEFTDPVGFYPLSLDSHWSQANQNKIKAYSSGGPKYNIRHPSSWGLPLLILCDRWLHQSDVSQSVSSVAQSCPTLCGPISRSTPGLPVHHQLPESTQTHVHQVGDAIRPCYPLSSPSPPALNLSQHQGLFKWVSSSHQVAKVLEFQLQHQSFQWTPRTDFL